MSRQWNGLDLQTEFSEILSDTSSAFKTRVLNWMNDIQLDIATRHDWSFLRRKGKKVLSTTSEIQNLYPASPGAPSAATSAAGSLTDATQYTIGITFVEGVSGYETKLGTTVSATTATPNLQIDLTSIPVSAEPLVTARKIYVDKAGAGFFYYGTISNNTTTTASVTANTTSTIEPPDFNQIRKLDGNPFFESGPGVQLRYKPLDQIRLIRQGPISSGTPDYWCEFGNSGFGADTIIVDPIPSSANTLSFHYYQLPLSMFASIDSVPGIPIYLKELLKAGVISLGYEYRDRDGQETKKKNYEDLMSLYISRTGKTFNARSRVRDVVGDADGFEV